MCQWPSKVSICPLKSVMMPNCSQAKTWWGRRAQDKLPWDVSYSLCRNSSVVQTHSFISCPSGWSQMIQLVMKPDVKVLGCRDYTWSAVMRPFGCTTKFSKPMLEEAYGREINITFPGNIPEVSMPIAHSVALCCVTKVHILKWPFIVSSTRCTCVMIMPFNQLLYFPHLSGRWIILAKEKCSLTGM